MRQMVQQWVDSCKCAAANRRNPVPPMKVRPTPKNPSEVLTVDFKGPIGPAQYYLHTTMDIYTRYPYV